MTTLDEAIAAVNKIINALEDLKETIAKLEDSAHLAGYKQGCIEGEEQGKSAGYDEGYSQGFDAGYGKGYADAVKNSEAHD